MKRFKQARPFQYGRAVMTDFQNKYRWARWLVVATGLAVALALVLTPSLQGITYTPEYVGGPRAKIAQTVYEYGDVRNNTMLETIIEVKNVGDKQLYFNKPPLVKVVEGCCPPQATVSALALNPGQSAQIGLSFSMHAGMDGPHDFRVQVMTNDQEEPEQEVIVRSNWVP
jgi:hypothetical protein